jgi:hypothetical protein
MKLKPLLQMSEKVLFRNEKINEFLKRMKLIFFNRKKKKEKNKMKF